MLSSAPTHKNNEINCQFTQPTQSDPDLIQFSARSNEAQKGEDFSSLLRKGTSDASSLDRSSHWPSWRRPPQVPGKFPLLFLFGSPLPAFLFLERLERVRNRRAIGHRRLDTQPFHDARVILLNQGKIKKSLNLVMEIAIDEYQHRMRVEVWKTTNHIECRCPGTWRRSPKFRERSFDQHWGHVD